MTDPNPHYNITDIYDILYSIDSTSLRKIAKGKTDELDDETKTKLSELKRITKELGWDQSNLSIGIEAVLKNRK